MADADMLLSEKQGYQSHIEPPSWQVPTIWRCKQSGPWPQVDSDCAAILFNFVFIITIQWNFQTRKGDDVTKYRGMRFLTADKNLSNGALHQAMFQPMIQ